MLNNIMTKINSEVRWSIQVLLLAVFIPLVANGATLQCSPQKGEATLNEVYVLNQNDNFLEVKIFDPAYTSYSGWKILYCADNARIGQCTTSVSNVATTMTQENVYWFTQQDVAGLNSLNANRKFTLLLVDSANRPIDRLTVNNARFRDTIDCSFYYDTTASTASNPKAITRNPDGTGDWEDAPGSGSGTVTTPGESNDGIPSVQIMADYRMDECYWDGTTGEVIDSTVTPYNGTSIGDANTTVNAGGGVCYNGNFLSNYVELPTFPHINGSRTITAWFNTKDILSGTHQRIFADDENNNNGSYALSVGDPGTGRVRFYIRGLSTVSLDTASVVAKDTWYFVAATFNSATMKKTLYIYDASGSLLNEVSQTVTGTVGTPSGKASLGGEVVGAEVANRFNGYLDEVKIFDGALYRTEIETIVNNERVGNNYDGTTRICGCTPGVIPKDGNYNAIDHVITGCSTATHWNNTLSTSILNDDINLSVLAKDIATDLPLEANITKITLMHYSDGNNNACTGTSLASTDVCTNCGLTDVDGCLSISIDKSLNQRASKCVEVLIEGKDKYDTTGVSLSESNASDNFAIRPDTYNCDGIAASTLVAEKAYSSTFNATPLNLTTRSQFYTTSSVLVSANKYMRTGELNASLSGAMSPSVLNFVDGNASAILIFNDACDVGIDLNDSNWANVDSDDTPEAQRVIHAECRRLFRPDHFLVALDRPLIENNASTGFTYLSNLSPSAKMSAWMKNLNMTLTAQGENNTTMQNYKDPSTSFYANKVTISPLITLPVKHSVATKQIDLVDANSSDITGFIFINGVATHSYEDVGFNYDRAYDTPIAPFRVDGNESFFQVNVQDRVYSSVIGEATSDSDANASFYFGRVRPSDIETTLLPVTNSLLFEVYDTGSPYTSGMQQSSLFWYVNKLHIGNNPGYVFEAVASRDTVIDNTLSGYGFIYNSVLNGQQDLDIIAASAKKSMIHLKTQEWLWYVPSSFGSAYDDGAGTDCTMHPCFNLSLINSSAFIIESGDFNGTVIPSEDRGDHHREGIKLFR